MDIFADLEHQSLQALPELPFEHGHIVVGTMHPDGGFRKVFSQRGQIIDRQRIDQDTLLTVCKLDEAQGFSIAMQTISLGINRTNRTCCSLPAAIEMLGKLLRRVDHIQTYQQRIHRVNYQAS